MANDPHDSHGPSLLPVASRFERAFGRTPTSIAFAPGRVNLIGEHVDYAEGVVLPIAIERGTAVAAAPTPIDSPSRLCSAHAETAAIDLDGWIADSERTRPAPHWSNYPLGVIALLREAGLDLPPLDVAIESELPIGGGLSSSASLCVATAFAAMAIAKVEPDSFGRLRLARLCREAEHRFAGVPCGLMDPAIVTLARTGHALRLDCRDGSIRQLPLPTDVSIVVFDSGVRHRLDEGGYATRQRDVQGAADALGVPSLRALLEGCGGSTAIAIARLHAASISDQARRRARHVVAELDRVCRIEAILAAMRGDSGRSHDLLRELGRILLEGHASLRDDFEVSTPELDAIVSAATDAGAFGARLTGAGFGGCAIALCHSHDAERIAAAVARRVSERFASPCRWFVTRASSGAQARIA